MAVWMGSGKPAMNLGRWFRGSRPPSSSALRDFAPRRRSVMIPFRCAPSQQHADVLEDAKPVEEDAGIICEPCNGRGWLLCDFCKGRKTNVKSENNRIYRRCPSCRAIGYVVCPSCKVFKCVTFPDFDDGEVVST